MLKGGRAQLRFTSYIALDKNKSSSTPQSLRERLRKSKKQGEEAWHVLYSARQLEQEQAESEV